MAFQTGGDGFFAQCGNHGISHIVVGFKAAGADTGADGGQKITGRGTKGLRHFLNRFFQDSGSAAAPTGMNGTDCLVNGIIQQDDSAIGGKHGKRQVGAICDQSIRGVVPFVEQALAGIGIRAKTDGCLVNLFAQDCPVQVCTGDSKKTAMVFQNGIGIVPQIQSEIQRVPRRNGDTAFSGGKGVSNSGKDRR